MKKLKKTDVVGRDGGGSIPYNPAWFTGDKLLLSPDDYGGCGEKGPSAKFQSLRNHARDTYGLKLRLDVRNTDGVKDSEGDHIGIQAIIAE